MGDSMINNGGDMQTLMIDMGTLLDEATTYTQNRNPFCVTCDYAPTTSELAALGSLQSQCQHSRTKMRNLYNCLNQGNCGQQSTFQQIRELHGSFKAQTCAFVNTAHDIVDTMEDPQSDDILA